MTMVAIGTEKGGYLLRSDDRRTWDVQGPLFAGWKVTAFGRAADGATIAGVGSNWFGTQLHRSEDLATWEPIADGPVWAEDSGRKLNEIWSLHSRGNTLFCGVADAGLFRSDDDGATWTGVKGLNEHESRPTWQPGGGGLCAHTILSDDQRLWVGISAVGVFRSEDDGISFTRHDPGVVAAVDEGAEADGWCVHRIVADPADPNRIWRQDHMGVYRTWDGGDQWERIETGLPNEGVGFGFPIVRDHASGRLFLVPLESSENRLPVDGRFAVWASDDDGGSWHVAGTGWPDAPTYHAVLRGALDTDQGDPGGVYLGTTSGQVWVTADTGESWTRIPETFPRIATVTVLD